MPEKPQVFLLNGPNLNLLGTREPEIYGTDDLATLESACAAEAKRLGVALKCGQTNAEHELIGWVQAARASHGIVLNPAAFGYSSYALVDALRTCTCPIIEVHLSNIHARAEPWRGRTLTAPAATATIAGLGVEGYLAALRALAAMPASGPASA